MLARSTHVVYLSAVLALLVALLLRPSSPVGRGSADDDAGVNQSEVSEAFRGLAQAVDPASRRTGSHARPVNPATPPLVQGGGRSAGHNHDQVGSAVVARCLEVVCDIDPDRCRVLANLHRKDPKEFERRIQEEPIGRRLLSMAQLKETDPDLYKSKLGEIMQSVQVNKVASQYHKAIKQGDQAQAEALRHQLRTMLRLQLAMSIKARTELLCHVEEQVQKLRAEIDREADHFDATIEGRFQYLTQNEPKDDGSILPAQELPSAATSAQD